MKEKKIKFGDKGLAKILIDKMLENHDVDYEWVMNNQQIDGMPWCTKLEWTQEQSNEYKKWFVDFFYTKVSPRKTKKWINREYMWFDLMYGLKIKE